MESAEREGPQRKFSFQAVLRTVVFVQLAATVAIVLFLLASTMVSSSSVDDLQRLTTGSVDAANIRDLLTTSDLALRNYIDQEGDFDAIQGYASAQIAMPVLVSRARESLRGDVSDQIGGWFREYVPYSRDYREPVVGLVVEGKYDEARELLLGEEARSEYRALLKVAATNATTAAAQREDARSRVSELQLISLIVAVALAALLAAFDIVLFIYVRREFTGPLSGLADSARKVGHGDFSSRAAGSSVSEIDVLARSFNTMAGELRRRMQELRQTTVDRTDFVSSVSHELRTPVTSLIGYLEMLRSGEAGELTGEQQTYVTVAERNAHQLDNLIGDLLTLSGLEHESVRLNLAETDVSQLILALKAEMLPIANEKNIDLIVVQTGDLRIEVDAVRIRQALANLVSNAIKFSDPGQAVVIRAFREGETLTIGVVDWGPGIATEDLSRIAEPFYRSTRHADVPGTGLGLAIAKQMAELHGGRLRVESELGQGSTFTLVLPCKQPERRRDATATGDAVV